MNTTILGRKGESLIHSILPGSIWVNEERDAHLPYDVIWNNTKIDVKSTEIVRKAKTDYCTFSAYPRTHQGDRILYAYVAFLEGKKYFWVSFPKETFSQNLCLSKAILNGKEVSYYVLKIITQL